MITRVILILVSVFITCEALIIRKDISFNVNNRIKICEDYASWNNFKDSDNSRTKSEIVLYSSNELSCVSTEEIFIPKGVLEAEVVVEFTSPEDIFTLTVYESITESNSFVKRSDVTIIHNGSHKIEIAVRKPFYGMVSLIGKTSIASKITLRSIYFSTNTNLQHSSKKQILKNNNYLTVEDKIKSLNTKRQENITIHRNELKEDDIKPLWNLQEERTRDDSDYGYPPLSASREENVNEPLPTTILFPSVSQATDSTTVTIPFPSVSQTTTESTTVTIPFPSVSQTTTVTIPFPSVSQTTTESTTVTIPFPSVSQTTTESTTVIIPFPSVSQTTTESTTVTVPFPSVSQTTTESTTVTVPFPSVSQTTTESTTVTIPFPSVSQTTTESTTVTIPFPSVSQTSTESTTVTVPFPSVSQTTTESTTVTIPFPSVSQTTTESTTVTVPFPSVSETTTTTVTLPETESPDFPSNENEGLSTFLITIISLSVIVIVIIISFIVAFLFCTNKMETQEFTEKP